MKTSRSGSGRTSSTLIKCLVSAVALGSINSAEAQKLWSEDFEGLALGPSLEEGLAGDKVWTNVPPDGWLWDNSKVPGVGTALDGITEWAGWGFANKDWWVTTAGNQRRVEWTFGQGTVMIADPDEWDDAGHVQGLYAVDVTTAAINLAGATANSLVLAFDSSWRPEARDDGEPSFPVGPGGERINNQTGTIALSYNDGPLNEVLRWDSVPDSGFYNGASIEF